jgi:anti-sigma factor RsiW
MNNHDELLSAYLAGELDDAEVEAVEARLAEDDGLSGRLAALEDALVALGGLDEVTPPPGYGDRLRARLDEERSAPVAPVVPLRRRLATVPAVAAGLVLVAVVAGGVLTLGQPSTEDAVEDTAADELAPQPEADEPADDVGEAVPPERVPEAGEPELRDAAMGPVLLDEEVDLADDEAVRERYRDLPEAAAAVGIPRETALAHAQAARDEITAAGPFDSGPSPATCLETFAAEEVPVRVESAVRDGQALLAHVLVRADGAHLDRVTAVLVDPDTCVTVTTVDVGP